MSTFEKSKRLLYIGIVGCLLYVIGDFLFAATGRGQTTKSIGFMVRVAYLEMGTWRMVASILCGFVGTLMYYMGFHRMHGLLKGHIGNGKNRIWVRLFRVAYVTGTVAWAYVHAMFMTAALIFKYIYQAYGDMEAAADIANRVFYAKRFFSSAPKEVCDVVPETKPERFPRQHTVGWAMIVLSFALMGGTLALGAWDGIRNGFGFWQFFWRFVIMLLGLKAFDVGFLDWFLLCNAGLNFFPHFYPETKTVLGHHLFGYNWKTHLTHIIVGIPLSALLAWICILF